ncbi:S8 family serine peptidase [Bdellovibrio svalbardensis]|uniref:S8 family serine peptidase n=1 Tax=Bdellovibrio svalbardensis TaxID=2972972 RepID=A0ABT6DHM2_9BACT|nr:S8 family serine peptidase [Bdellovibrio svalbardensis]MDG0816312.1 S8 family serine peptidase [Bdellovibrio svalbardensis]
MKLNVFSLILSVLLATSAQASQRVIVIMKDQQSFKAAHMAFRTNGAYALKGSGIKSSLATVDGQVEASLENLNTLIVNAKNDSEISKLQADPSVAYVEKEVFHEAPRPVAGWLAAPAPTTPKQVPGAKTPWGILAVKAPQAWAVSKQGAGARVLVLDTGIDANHPSLKANYEQGKDFTGASSGADVTDLVGHGSHCSGTIAGVMDSSGFTGVAPKAKILMGRVCAENGCSNVAIASGINWGISQKVDVISMSLGGAWSTPAERDAVAKADKAGVTVVAASGNDGSNKVSYPAALPSVIAVGAVDNNLKKADFSQYGKELAIVAPGVDVISTVPQGTGRESSVTLFVGQKSAKVNSATFQGAREVLNGETNVLVDCGLGKPEDFTGKDVKGKYALISRGEIAFGDKIKNAIAAGATGAVIYNNAPGLLQGSLTADGSTLPAAVFMIEQTVGQQLVAALKAKTPVKATVQTVATDYASFQGTSMATPHVAGVVALIKATNKTLTGAQVKEILKKTATALGPNSNNEYGAGMVNAEAAVNAAAQVK